MVLSRFTNKIKENFPIFKNQPKLVYLDNASTTQTPRVALDAMNFYYEQRRANIHRGVYQLSALATELYEESRQIVAKWLNASDAEVVFTSGTTHGLNLLAYSLGKDLKPGDNVVLTRMEHHANLVPWVEMSKRYGFEVKYIELTADGRLLTVSLPIDKSTKIVSFCHISNTLGTINPVAELVTLAKKVDAMIIIDAAQSVAHLPVDVKALDCDFLIFSGHKMYGPTGIGILYGKKARLEKLEPFFFGGDMIREVRYDGATWNDVPWKFEGGTPNIAGAIGLAAAVRWLTEIGLEAIKVHEQELRDLTIRQLDDLADVTIVGPRVQAGPIISFVVKDIHPHDVAQILDSHNIAVRAGHHCAMPLMNYLGLDGTVRISFGVYNSKEDIDTMIEGLKDIITRFSRKRSGIRPD